MDAVAFAEFLTPAPAWVPGGPAPMVCVTDVCGWSILNPLAWVGKGIGTLVGSVVELLAEAMAAASMWLLEFLVGFVSSNPRLNLKDTEAITWIHDSLSYATGLFMLLGVLVGAGSMAWHRRGEPLRDMLASVIQLVIVSGAGVTVVQLLMEASSLFSSWLLASSGSMESVQAAINVMIDEGTNLAILTIFLLAAMLLGTLLALILLLCRDSFLVLLIGILPLSAAATNTAVGRQWFEKTKTWIIAFLLYKPAFAIILSIGMRLISSGSPPTMTARVEQACGTFDEAKLEEYQKCVLEQMKAAIGDDSSLTNSVTTILVGVGVLCLAGFAMPALMRFVVPATASMSSGAGMSGIAAGLGGAAGSLVASGAIKVARGGVAAARGGVSKVRAARATKTSASSTASGSGGVAATGATTTGTTGTSRTGPASRSGAASGATNAPAPNTSSGKKVSRRARAAKKQAQTPTLPPTSTQPVSAGGQASGAAPTPPAKPASPFALPTKQPGRGAFDKARGVGAFTSNLASGADSESEENA
ncbi:MULTISPECIES: hypothetical protein [Actinomycetaceae]|uniref:Conjugal transfer protein TrbL n=1 Tax=Actinotignum sanguinis TaxID=1445614 RepID=A0ABT5V7I0_9ACTO|nr:MULTISPECIES: hypothetical protein [Actinotignum]MDE1552489.1 hypothetical protein [Actinotignum sanguinis]MDE1642047.1 hypothetical protein [Actinotignum sanguinis]MDE1656909.1 hypothetical protein [Actinotignum sanguinis]MDK6907275.1 hypothetical protein [Actinotignum timonense]MDK8353345.1 hypothetical protein [Actinotignum sanguinis]